MSSQQELPNRIRLSRSLGLYSAMVRGFEIVAAALVFTLIGEAAAWAGPFTPLAVLLAALLILLNGLGYGELVASVAAPGGAYTLVREARGGELAFFIGWALALANLGFCALLAQGVARYLGLIVAGLTGLPVLVAVLAMVAVILAVLDGSLGKAGRWRAMLMLTLVILLVTLPLLPAPHIQAIGYSAYGRQVGPAVALLLPAFIGLGAIARRREEIRRQAVDLPRALLAALLLAALSGAGLAGLVIYLAGARALAGSPAPLAPLIAAFTGHPGEVAITVLGFLVLLLSLRRAILLPIYRLYTMGEDGLWPDWLYQVPPRSRVPVRLIFLTGLFLLLAVWIPTALLSRVSGLLYLVALMIVNLTLARRRRQSPAPSFALPFHPWVPSLVLGLDLLLIPLWGWEAVAWTALCLAAGGVFYLVYGRSRQMAARERVTIFRQAAPEHAPTGFRVLVPIAAADDIRERHVGSSQDPRKASYTQPDAAVALLQIAGRLAQAQGGTALALQVVVVPDSLPLAAGSPLAQAEQMLLEKTLCPAIQEGLPIETMARLARSVGQGIAETAGEEKVDLILLDWRGPARRRGASLGRVLDTVLRDAPCDVLIMRSQGALLPKRILVPTAGGPHAQAAAQLAQHLAEATDGQVTLLYVQHGEATPQQMEENRHALAGTLQGLSPERPPNLKLIVAPSVVEGITKEAEGYDLVLLGVSEESLLDRFVFGSVPLQVAARVPATALVQSHRSGREVWTHRFLHALQRSLPVLGLAEALEVRQELGRAAKPNDNYFVMIMLSTIIAALGLLLNSPAIVIGAMLVAPLMSPILAFSLGTIMGDGRLARHAGEAILKGVVLTVIIAAFIGLLSPFKGATGEMLVRGRPTLLDLAVALASGAAGAYALARKGIPAVLPGVAIAAALTPPLATVGLSLAMGHPQVTSGAFGLFIANIAAISLAGGVTFVLLGVHPFKSAAEAQRWLHQGLFASLVLLVAIAIPLRVIVKGIIRDEIRERLVRQVVTERLASRGEQLVSLGIEPEQAELRVTLTLHLARRFDQQEVDALARALTARLGCPVELEVIALPVMRSETSG